jgi:AraC-like DNA-binding protein
VNGEATRTEAGAAARADALPRVAVYAPPKGTHRAGPPRGSRGAAHAPTVGRDHARALARAAFPRRRAHLLVVRTADELAAAFRRELIDASLIDLGDAHDDAWRAAELAREFPSAAFFAVTPLRAADAPVMARCAELEFADVLVDGIDDGAARDLVLPATFHARFAAALRDPPPALGLGSALQREAWRCIIAHGGLPVRTETVARAIGVSREHLSRAFACDAAPNVKRVIDLVRLIAAAELAKNPGYDIRDVALVLRFASASHLSTTAQRVVGMRPTSLARLRAVDLVERFAQGRGRSRG